ncbi:MAG: type I-E CRISPR-associated protein Cas5/CasD [Myxococcales bacterium]|nr:type I-E CRISPR-associated protein Cas5/CasD [Myxococcota bacterium]MDW8284359.1 type I-E CRISPR-associated protein Cas5/CasD [Myxococcales bacterium]
MRVLLLRFDAPLMSFGGVMVDQHGPTDRFPGTSLLTGLFGNALGWRHSDADRLEALQARIEYAARWDVAPEPLLDYHTVDLGQPKMREAGWTTRGEPEHRAGGEDARYGTHIRLRHYWVNGVMTVAVALAGEENPTTDDLVRALQEPARPLFIGRKTCLPAAPILLGTVEASDVLAALRKTPPSARRPKQAAPEMEACWPDRIGETATSRRVVVYDRRDWRNQIHAGRRIRIEGLLQLDGGST